MGLLVYFSQIALLDQLMSSGALIRLASILLIIFAASFVYLGVVVLTGAIPREQLLRLIRRRKKPE
jgi:hypothetical protein